MFTSPESQGQRPSKIENVDQTKRTLEAQDLTGQLLGSNDQTMKSIKDDFRNAQAGSSRAAPTDPTVMDQIIDLYTSR
jgi:hypothetical protein